MNKKLKGLLSVLALTGVMGMLSACATEEQSGSSNLGTSNSVSESVVPESSSPESTEPEVVKYTVKFVNDDDTVISETEYEEGAAIVVPADPTKETADGYEYTFAGWDSEVAETATGDVTYKATYTKVAIEYTVSFTHPRTGMPVAAPITYTVENMADVEFPAVPEELAMEGYTVAWNKTEADLAIGGTDVNPVWTAIEYTVSFTHPRTGMPVAEPITYTVENMADVVFPAVPEMEGYTGAWNKTPADLAIGGLDVNPEYTANTYTITYNANGGTATAETQEVTFDSGYTLATATAPKSYQEFLGWVDEDGNAFAAEGDWTIASDVTLTAVYSAGITFTNMTAAPSYMEIVDTTESLSITELDGNKVLEIKSTSTGVAPGLKVTTEWLKSFFEDESVDYIAFDAKMGTTTINNFRRVTLRENGTFAADCYEHDMTYTHDADGDGTAESYPTTGIRADSWKTFYFSRTDYNAWVNRGVTSERFIAAGQCNAGDSIYVDNIRPVTAAERKAGVGSFESGGVRINDAGKTLLFYMLDKGTTWQFNMQVGSGVFTNVGYTNEDVTDGIRALQFTKPAGDLAFNFTTGRDFYDELITATGYYALDVYVPADSDAKISFHTTNWPGVEVKKGAWTTIYVNTNNQLIIKDTTGGTYKVDNLRSITEAEYNNAALGFEANVSGLRTKELGDDTTNSGVAYYYGGADHSANKFSFAIAEGNGENDVAVLSNVRLSSEQAHSGTYSLALDKKAGYLYFTMRNDSTAFENLSNGFTFWIYSTVEIDGVNTKNMVNGVNEKFNGGEGMIIPANTWTKVTVTAADMNPTRFLILQGDIEGTIYLDDFQPLD